MKYSACLVGFKAPLKAIGSFVSEWERNWKILQVKLVVTVESQRKQSKEDGVEDALIVAEIDLLIRTGRWRDRETGRKPARYGQIEVSNQCQTLLLLFYILYFAQS